MDRFSMDRTPCARPTVPPAAAYLNFVVASTSDSLSGAFGPAKQPFFLIKVFTEFSTQKCARPLDTQDERNALQLAENNQSRHP